MWHFSLCQKTRKLSKTNGVLHIVSIPPSLSETFKLIHIIFQLTIPVFQGFITISHRMDQIFSLQPREVGQSLLTDCQPSHTPIVVPQPKVVDGCSRPKEELGPASFLTSFSFPVATSSSPLLWGSYLTTQCGNSPGLLRSWTTVLTSSQANLRFHHHQLKPPRSPLLLFGLVLSRDKRKTENVFLWKIEDK